MVPRQKDSMLNICINKHAQLEGNKRTTHTVLYKSSNVCCKPQPVRGIFLFLCASPGIWIWRGPDIVKSLCPLWIYWHVCVCSTICRGGWANVGESPGLSCCCTFPPGEFFTFPEQPSFCPAFLSEDSLKEIKPPSWWRDSRPLAFSSFSSISINFLLFPLYFGGGGRVHT